MRVIDGLHRVRAAQLAGRLEIDIEYFDGTDNEAFALSVHLNVGHGLPLGMEDRKSAASIILSKNAEAVGPVRSSSGWAFTQDGVVHSLPFNRE